MARSKRRSQVYRGASDPQKVNEAGLNHDTVARMYQRVIQEIAVNRFQWRGLPEGIDHRFLELRLMYDGNAVFYHDNDFDRFMVGRAAMSGQPNVYDNPTQFTIVRAGMPSLTLSGQACVPIYSNYMRMPDMDIVRVFSNKLARIDRTIDINLIHMRHPFIVSVSEERRLSVANALKAVNDGEFAVVGSDAMNPMDEIKAFNTGISDTQVMNLIIAKQKMWNECMTLLGVNNSNQDKKERLVADEVSGNDEQVMANRGVGLNSRSDACELINAKWGLAVECVWGPVPATVSLGEPGDQVQAAAQAGAGVVPGSPMV